MTKLELIGRMEALLEVVPGSLREEDRLGDLAGWDSLTIMAFMALMDGELGVIPDPKSILNCKTVGELVALTGSGLEG